MDIKSIVIGGCIRMFLYHYDIKFSLRYLDSPYTSLLAYQEGVEYLKHNLSPYFEGSPVHSPPLLLYLYSLTSTRTLFHILFLLELVSTYTLFKITKVTPNQNSYSVNLFYLNPFSIYMLLSLSMAPISVLALLGFIHYTMSRRRIRAAYILSLLVYADPSTGIIASLWYFNHFTFRIYLHTAFMLIVLYASSTALYGSSWVLHI